MRKMLEKAGMRLFITDDGEKFFEVKPNLGRGISILLEPLPPQTPCPKISGCRTIAEVKMNRIMLHCKSFGTAACRTFDVFGDLAARNLPAKGGSRKIYESKDILYVVENGQPYLLASRGCIHNHSLEYAGVCVLLNPAESFMAVPVSEYYGNLIAKTSSETIIIYPENFGDLGKILFLNE